MSAVLLPARSPEEFRATHLVTYADRFEGHDDEPDPRDGRVPERWIDRDDLLAADAALLGEQHRAIMTEETPAPAAAKYLVGWYGGWLAETVGFVYAMTGAGVLADATVRWHQHSAGWIDRVDVARCRVAVPEGHPWSGLPGVETVLDDDRVRERAVAAMVEVLTPVLAGCRSLARVGWSSLWAEVADGVGLALAFTPDLEQAPAALPALHRLLDAPGAPWRARPQAWVLDTPSGPFAVGRKGGCCLAYTASHEPADLADLDEEHRARLERFPVSPDTPDYCTTCCFRDVADVEARQLFWLERHRARTSGPGSDEPHPHPAPADHAGERE